MAKQEPAHPWQQIEEQAFHAFREWPLWLVLRGRELASRRHEPSGGKAAGAPSVAANHPNEES